MLNKAQIRKLSTKFWTEEAGYMGVWQQYGPTREVSKDFITSVVAAIERQPTLRQEQFDALVDDLAIKWKQKLYHCENQSIDELNECIVSKNNAMMESKYQKFLTEYDIFKEPHYLHLDTYEKEADALKAGFKRFMAREHGDVNGAQAEQQIDLFDNMFLKNSAQVHTVEALKAMYRQFEEELQSDKGTSR